MPDPPAGRSQRPRLLRSLLLGAAALAACGPSGGPPNLLLVSIDTLRADHLGAYGYPRATSPFLDQLAADGLLFEEALVPLPATDPSHASLFTSLHPIEHGVMSNASRLAERFETLAEVLREHGYATLGAVAARHLSRAFGFGQGFDVFSDGFEGDDATRGAPEVNASVLAMLDDYVRADSGKPLFLFVHYFDVHSPYERHAEHPVDGAFPEARAHAWSDEQRDRVDRYDSEVRRVDDHLRALYARLAALGLTRNLVVCVVSDHGEQLGEHGTAEGHADLYRETVRIPLLLHGTGIRSGREARTVSSMDVAVSLLDRLGLHFSERVSGRTLHAGAADDASSAAAEAPRPLLIAGYPRYTRSLATVEDRLWFIRNLDHVYRNLIAEPIDAAQPPRGEALAPHPTGDDVFYALPVPTSERLETLLVSVEVRLRDPACPARVAVYHPGLARYLPEGLGVGAALRVRYPASTRDATVIGLSPGRCAADVYASSEPLASALDLAAPSGGGARTLPTQLWQELLTERKHREQDELYDVARDPEMLTDLAADAEHRAQSRELAGETERLWARTLEHGDDLRALEPLPDAATLELLKSLGYVE